MNIEKVRWRALQSTVGVLNVICSGENSAQVPPDVLKLLKSREDENGFINLGSGFSIHSGEHVRIIDGALSNLIAITKKLHGLDRVTLLLRIMSRKVSVNTS